MYHKSLKNIKKIFSIAPMMDWSDRHCRYFHRLMTKNALLYTEMVVVDAILHGDLDRHLGFSEAEHPIALQLGGSEPGKMAKAARIGASWGYDEINLNVGCPSDRVQSGTFGACLMLSPDLVGECVKAMRSVVGIPVTVKCRIGVDDQDTETALDNFADAVFANGCDALWVHARKAWLEGLSPKQNRDIPPLDYDRVYRLKQKYPNKFIGINGGIETLEATKQHLNHVDGVMLGRAAYHNPEILRYVDKDVFASDDELVNYDYLADKMMSYTARHIDAGGRANHVTRHMLGLFKGRAGSRRYRQIMTVDSCKPGASEQVIKQAFAVVLDNELMLTA
jgi:tRNA-dihydrouridine synthase A